MKPIPTALLAALAFGALLPRAGAQSAGDADLAKKALGVLDKNCSQCHGPNGKGEGHDLLDFILDVKKLTTDDKHYIVPGDPAQSMVMKKLKKGTMPPRSDEEGKPVLQRPSAEDVAVVEAWIKAGAPEAGDAAAAPARDFISLDKMVEAMNADLQKMKRPIDQQHTRYFVLTALYNAGVPDAQLDLYRAGLSKLVNSLSRKNPRIVVPKAIDDARTIFRIDLRDYSWNENTWDEILADYPYGVMPDTADARDLAAATGCKTPFVRADWFVFTASKPPLYEDILQLPTNATELERQLGIDSGDDVQRERVARAAFNRSGVSNNNRLLERHEFAHGAYYRSADFAGNSDGDRKNLFSHPLDYVPDGGEIIFNLPNGLQAYMLVNKDGDRIEEGPIKIVHDPDQPDKAVINGISCMSCHDRGMKDKDDEIRGHVLANPNAFTEDEKDKILALYPEKEVFRKLLEEDAERFREACKKAGAPIDLGAEPVKALASRFERELDLPAAAGELGLTVEDFKKMLDGDGDLGKVFGPLNVNGGTVKREVWEAKFPDLVEAAGVGILPGGQAGGVNPAGPADKLIEQARKALDDGDRAKALDLFGQAVAKDPNNAAAFQGRGALLLEDGKYADAVADFQKVHDLLPNDVDAALNLGIAHSRNGDGQEAIAAFTAVIALDEKKVDAYALRADAEIGLAKYDEAVADLEKAVELSPDDALLHAELGGAYLLNGAYDDAIDEATTAIDKDPDLALAYRVRGQSYDKRGADGDADRARQDLDKAAEIEKDK